MQDEHRPLRFRIGRTQAFFAAWVLALTFLLAGCGGGGGGDGDLAVTSALDSGTVIIGLTDADGDFLTYTVDVLSLTLTKADGAVIETLPNSTRIDFAQYTEMTEFVTAATIPAGVYTHAAMTLDYGSADIQVERNGQAVPVVIQDTGGGNISTLDLTVRLSDRHRLVIAPGIPAHLTLDFDLAASNDVDMTMDPPIVTVEPFLVADVNPEQPKIHRVRGPFRGADLEGDAFDIMIRPWHLRRGDFGSLRVLVDEDTAYEIDGLTYIGKQGLEALDGKPSGTAVAAIGRLNRATRAFEASEVYAGSSVSGGDLDVVTGNITARSGDVLSLRGVTLVRSDGTVIFNDDVAIDLGAGTKVVRQALVDTGLDKEDLSVGQRITAFGVLVAGRPGSLELDATAGLVRMLISTLAGEVVSANAGSLLIDLQSIDRRRVSIFDFTGTGTDSASDADPANYGIATGTLDTASLSPLDPVKVRGFVRPFGQAPADFEAKTIVDVSSIRALLAVSWAGAGTTSPFQSLSSDNLVVNLDPAETGRLQDVRRACVITDLYDLGSLPAIQPADDNQGLFAIRQHGVVQVFTRFANFVQDLEQRLDGSATVKAVFSTGRFENATATMTAGRVAVKMAEQGQ